MENTYTPSENMFVRFFENIFNRWSKWELYSENKRYIKIMYASPVLGGYEIGRIPVLVDIYCKTNKFNGIKKYKRVEKR